VTEKRDLVRYGIVGLVASAASFGIAAATTGASSTRPHHFYPAPGDSITIRSVDLLCHVYRNDPTRFDISSTLFCVRASEPGSSRGFGASREHIWVDYYVRKVDERFARAP
jgi:hypothetical protein